MIVRTTYKDRPAYLVRGGRLSALFLPEDGGKMASLTDGAREYLAQAPGETYLRLFPDSDYVSCECSGFDDMFPTIDPYTPSEGMCAGIPYPDHGEVCRYPQETACGENSLSFVFRSRRFPVVFSKNVSVSENGALAIDYTLDNRGNGDYPYLWAAHCMLAASADAQIVLPYGADAEVRPMFGALLSRTHTQPYSPEGESYKFYFTQPAAQGYCGYRYAGGRTLMLRYPPEIVRYLGIWINNGSFKGMYNIALEPCTAPYDRPDAAQAAACGSVIPAGESVRFRLTIDLEGKEGEV